jgi:hypothetical protein
MLNRLGLKSGRIGQAETAIKQAERIIKDLREGRVTPKEIVNFEG